MAVEPSNHGLGSFLRRVFGSKSASAEPQPAVSAHPSDADADTIRELKNAVLDRLHQVAIIDFVRFTFIPGTDGKPAQFSLDPDPPLDGFDRPLTAEESALQKAESIDRLRDTLSKAGIPYSESGAQTLISAWKAKDLAPLPDPRRLSNGLPAWPTFYSSGNARPEDQPLFSRARAELTKKLPLLPLEVSGKISNLKGAEYYLSVLPAGWRAPNVRMDRAVFELRSALAEAGIPFAEKGWKTHVPVNAQGTFESTDDLRMGLYASDAGRLDGLTPQEQRRLADAWSHLSGEMSANHSGLAVPLWKARLEAGKDATGPYLEITPPPEDFRQYLFKLEGILGKKDPREGWRLIRTADDRLVLRVPPLDT